MTELMHNPAQLYNHLVEETQAIVIERVTNARDEAIRMSWELGETITRYEYMGVYEKNSHENSKEEFLQRLAKDINVSVRNLKYSCAFFAQAPDIDLFLEKFGKNLTISMINTQIIPALSNGMTLDEVSEIDWKAQKQTTTPELVGKYEQELLFYRQKVQYFDDEPYVPLRVIEDRLGK